MTCLKSEFMGLNVNTSQLDNDIDPPDYDWKFLDKWYKGSLGIIYRTYDTTNGKYCGVSLKGTYAGNILIVNDVFFFTNSEYKEDEPWGWTTIDENDVSDTFCNTIKDFLLPPEPLKDVAIALLLVGFGYVAYKSFIKK